MQALRLHSPLRSLIGNWTGARPKTALAIRAEACPTCNGQQRTFACPRWPACGCPEGAIDPACPGETVACACRSDAAVGTC